MPALPDLSRLKKGDLNSQTIMALDRAFRPTGEEVAGMIDSICRRKQWSRQMLAAIIGVPPESVRSWEVERIDAPLAAAKLIWFIYTLDTAPELAMDMMHIVTWGKITARLPHGNRRLKGDERQKAIAWIQNWPNDPEYNHRKLTIRNIAEKFSISKLTAGVLCKEANYRPGNGHLKTYRPERIPDFLKPTSIYLHVDWNQKDPIIAERVGISKTQVRNVRYKFRKMPHATLRRHLKACGIDEAKFERIFRRPVKKYDLRKMGKNFEI